ncbi:MULTISPECIES: hypothetical protein [Erysipelotrichaceae]|uniref:hypothetical protein n=1 Tax=Erysipelotrichaceae TaxID=128827 RepID=UPI00259BED81|nr:MULTISPECIES: hypothetical protein [Erysipelotrichaceae]
MDQMTTMWSIICNAGKFAGIVIGAFGIIKVIISIYSHDSNQTSSNVFLIVAGVVVWLVFNTLAGMSLNFG